MNIDDRMAGVNWPSHYRLDFHMWKIGDDTVICFPFVRYCKCPGNASCGRKHCVPRLHSFGASAFPLMSKSVRARKRSNSSFEFLSFLNFNVALFVEQYFFSNSLTDSPSIAFVCHQVFCYGHSNAFNGAEISSNLNFRKWKKKEKPKYANA